MELDPKKLPKGKIGCGALIVLFIIGCALYMREFRHPFVNDPPDYGQLLESCRDIIRDQDNYPSNRPDIYRKEGVLIDFGRPVHQYSVDRIIKDLYPYHMIIFKDHLKLVLQEKLIVTAYSINADTVPDKKDKELIDGLYIEHIE